jgi:hypothetical protein
MSPILKLDQDDEARDLEFEPAFQCSLTTQQMSMTCVCCSS